MKLRLSRVTTSWFRWFSLLLGVLVVHEALAGGQCSSARFNFWQCLGCNQAYAPIGGTSPATACPCQTNGMPRWAVNEPYITLSLYDEPLSYTMSSGQKMSFQFYYRQQVTLPGADQVPSYATYIQPGRSRDVYPGPANCGTNAAWNHNWNMSMVMWSSDWISRWRETGVVGSEIKYSAPSDPLFSDNIYETYVFQPEGGVFYFNSTASLRNPATQISLSPLARYPLLTNNPTHDANNIYWGDDNNNIGMKLVHPDGSQEIFGLVGFDIVPSNYVLTPTTPWYAGYYWAVRLLLTKRIDAQGRVTQLGYEQFTPNVLTAYRLKYVVDPDGRTSQFSYTAANSFLVQEIDDPYGRKTVIGYDGNQRLNSLQDAAGLTSSVSYPSVEVTTTAYYASTTNDVVLYYLTTTNSFSGSVTNLFTPYGNTAFSYYEMDDSTVPDGMQQRAVYVSEPEGAQQLYYYLHKGTSLLAATASSPSIPGQLFDDGTSAGIHPTLDYRNTIYWGPRQFSVLSSAVQSALPGNMSNALASLTANDFRKGRVRNWLWQTDGASISDSLGSERDPSPDSAGSIEASRLWFGYAGKTAAEQAGSSPQITCLARILPDGDTNYTTYNFYSGGAGLVSDNETTYSKPDGTVGLLTNWFAYAGNEVDLLNVTNSWGQHVNYGYNGSHQVVAMTNALNQVTTFSWNPNLTGIQLPSGQNISLGYYLQGMPDPNSSSMLQWMIIMPEGRCSTNNSYFAGLPVSVTDDRGVTLQNTWDGLNRLTSTIFPDTTYISNRYDRLDLGGSRDRMNNWTSFVHDGLQRLVYVTNANLAVTSYGYCGCGALESYTNAAQNVTYFGYDNQGNLKGITYPDSSSIAYTYDIVGRMVSASDGLGRTVQISYNNQGLATNYSGAYGTLRSIVYDALNRPISVTDANGINITNQYDLINQLTNRLWPDGISESFVYATNGLIAYTNRDNQGTHYLRDQARRLLAVTNANQEVTLYAYDSLNNVTNLTDGNGNQTAWQYNEYGWQTNKINALGSNVVAYTYNPDGWVTNRWTPEKGKAAYTYDNVGNRTGINYGTTSITYTYDALNRLQTMLDGLGGTTIFGYDQMSRLQSETTPWTYNSANVGLAYGYTQGQRTSMNIMPTSSEWSQSYQYDSMWRMTNVASLAGQFGYSYNFQPASSLLSDTALPNGGSITNNYDGLGRLLATKLLKPDNTLLDTESYLYDPASYRTQQVFTAGNYITYVYDKVGQLKIATGKEPGGVTNRLQEQLGYTYDKAGNLFQRTNNQLIETFDTDKINQLTNIIWNGMMTLAGVKPAGIDIFSAWYLTIQFFPPFNIVITVHNTPDSVYYYSDFTFATSNSYTLTAGENDFPLVYSNSTGVTWTNTVIYSPVADGYLYDQNGNLTNDGYRSFGYDQENQLTNVTAVGDWKSDFVYDGLGRRRIEKDYAWQSGGWQKTDEIHFVYDRNLLVQERDSGNNILCTYTRGLDMGGGIQSAGGIGGLLARTDGNGSTFYHSDGNGNVMALVNGSQNLVARYLYNPFGQIEGKWGPLADANEMQFSSMPHHNLSGLSLYPFRAYEPNLQRWLNHDPIQERGGLNLYGFVGNNPINRFDRFGLSPMVGAEPYIAAMVAGAEGKDVQQAVNNQFDANMAAEFWPILYSEPDNGFPDMPNGTSDGPIHEDPYGYILTGGAQGLLQDAGDASALSSARGSLKPKQCPTKAELNAKYPYRTPWRKGVDDDVYNYAKSQSRDGKVYDPSSGVEINPDDPWEFGHEPPYKLSDWQQRAWEENWPLEDWNDFLNDPFYYRPETWRSNSSHVGEDPYP